MKNVGGTYRFIVTQGSDTRKWTVDLTKEPIFVGERDGRLILVKITVLTYNYSEKFL